MDGPFIGGKGIDQSHPRGVLDRIVVLELELASLQSVPGDSQDGE
jgi:hypothetical protein